MKTAKFYDANDTLRTALILDSVPENGSEYPGTDCVVYASEEVRAYIEADDEGIRNGTAYLVRAEDPAGKRWEFYCIVPMSMVMTAEEFVQNMMDNDEENIRYMTVKRAAEILDWTRSDDYKNEIPESLTAEEFARIWNEAKGAEIPSKRYEIMDEDEDMGWCRCFRGTTPGGNECWVVQFEGKITAMRIGDRFVDNVTDPEEIKALAKAVNLDYDNYNGYSNKYIVATTMERCGCRSCPWRDMCDAMDEIED